MQIVNNKSFSFHLVFGYLREDNKKMAVSQHRHRQKLFKFMSLPCEYRLRSWQNIQASLIFYSLIRYLKFLQVFFRMFFHFSKAHSGLCNCRICNYLRIKRLFGLHGNWVTRWQPFLFQSSLLFCINDITPDTQRYNFFMNEQKGGAFFIIVRQYLNLVYHQSAIYEFPDSVIRPFPLLVCEGSTIALES